MNTNDGLSFAAAIDTSEYEKGLDRMRTATESMNNVISHSFGGVATLSEKYGELSRTCDGYQSIMKSLSDELNNYKTIAQQAFNAGDTKSFDDAIAKVNSLEVQIMQTAQEAQGYADALNLVSQQMGMVAQTPPPPMFFTEEQLNAVDALNERLASLNQRLSERPDETTYNALKEEISSVTSQIASMESEAAKAAAKLGSDLGGRAAEATSNLHNLNVAIKQQESACNKLREQAATAAKELKSLKESAASQEEISRAQATYDSYTQSLHNAELQLIALQGAQNDAKNALTRVSAEVDSHNSIMVKMLGGYEKYNQVLSFLPAPLQSVIAGINGMTGAAKAFIATPLGAIIAAIVLALQALNTWFNSSVEGQLKFAEISGYVSGVLGQLKEIVISVGKAIYDAFTNPKEAITDFVNFLKSQVMNRIKAIGDMFGSLGDVISNVFKGDFDAAKQSLSDMGKSFVDFQTGVENTIDKVSQWGNSVNEAATATAQISRATKELQMEASRWQQKEIEYNTKMNELYTKMMDNSLSKEQKKKYQKDYEDLINLVSDQKIKLAQKAVDLQKQKMSLTTNSMEDEMQLDQLNANLAQAQGYKAEKMRMAQRVFNRINTTTADPQNGIDKANEQAEIQMKRALQDTEYRVAQAEINAKEEGEEKTLAQMKLNHKRELQELDRQREDYLQKKIDTERAKFAADPSNKGKHFDSSAISLTNDEESMFDAQRADVLKKQQNESQEYTKIQQQAMNEYLAQWGTYLQKRQALTDIANEKIAKATTEGEKLSITAQLTKDLSNLDMEATKTTSAIGKLFGDMSKKTIKELRAIASDGTKALDLLTAPEYDEILGASLSISEETWKTLKDSPVELEKIRKAIEQLENTADGMETPLGKIAKGLEDIFKSGGDTEKLKQGLRELQNGMNEVFGAVSVLSNALGQLGDAFGSGFLSGAADALNGVMDVMNSTMQGAQAGMSIAGPWGAAAGAAIGLVGSLGSALSKLHDKKHEKKIQRIQEQIEALEKSYDKLEKEIDKSYSKDASKLIEQNNKILEQKKALIQQQIKEEEAKKKTDQSRIKEWKNQLDEINEAIAENKEKAVDAIFGEDLKTAIENFSSAYADAWASGESRAKSAKDTVKEMMRKMVMASINGALQSSDAIKKIRDQLDAFYTDNVLSDWEQKYVLNMAQELQEELDRQFGWADSLLKDSSFQQGGSSGGFQAMSEDTGSELNGRFLALQIAGEKTLYEVEEIKLITQSIGDNFIGIKEGMVEIQNINLLQLAQLESINTNTKQLYAMNERLEQIERNTKNL